MLLLFFVIILFLTSSSCLISSQQQESSSSTIKFPKKLLDATSEDSPFVKESNSGRLLYEIDQHEPTNKNFCFVSHGCWGGSEFGKVTHKKVANLISAKTKELDGQFVLAAGDNFYTKGIKSVKDPRFADVFTNVYVKAQGETMKNIPHLVALGNHDARGNIFAQINMTYRDPNWFFPYTYYSVLFRKASVAIVVLDCPLFERCVVNPPGSPRCWDNDQQKYFLEEALKYAIKEKISHRVVMCHYPMYANGPHVNHPFLKKLLDPVMEKYQVSMYINADNHYIQVSKHKRNGIYYVNSGGGGGYRLHKKSDKGYRVDKNNVFEYLGNGVFTHCLNTETNLMKTSAFTIDDGGKKELFSFETKGAEGMSKKMEVSDESTKKPLISKHKKVIIEMNEREDSSSTSSTIGGSSGGGVMLIRQADWDSTALSTIALLCVVVILLMYRLTKQRGAKQA